ncbi:hypothetical protein ACFX11_002990 [Malus domestica]
MNRLTNRADSFAYGVKEHEKLMRLGPKITETVKGKLRLGAKIIKAGGTLEVFKHTFSTNAGEKLLKASQCYLSTTAGLMADLLFISTDKITFCSERSIKLPSSDSDGQQLVSRVHYKVVIPVKKIKAVNQSENRKKSSQKYVEIVTVDDFDFWFMGILNYHKHALNLHRHGQFRHHIFAALHRSSSVVKQDTLKARAQSAKTATKVSEMVGNVNTSNAPSAFDKMEERGITFISSKRRKSRAEVTTIKEDNDSCDAHQRSRDNCGGDGMRKKELWA